jgi:hypothetical protein
LGSNWINDNQRNVLTIRLAAAKHARAFLLRLK